MTEVLGYERFAAQGGDWGAFITARLTADYPQRLHGKPRRMMLPLVGHFGWQERSGIFPATRHLDAMIPAM